MPWGAIIGAVAAPVIGGLFGKKASSKAADAQTQAADQQIAEQRRQFDEQQALQAPFRSTGVAGNQRLAYLMGLGGQVANDPNAQLTPDAVKSLYRHYLGRDPDASEIAWQLENTKTAQAFEDTIKGSAEFQQQGRSDPGRLFGNAGAPGENEAGFLTRRFAASDLQKDPVYQSGLQFGLDRGTGEINARAIAGGGYDSGATIKALTRYANDYGSTKANESYNRFTNDQGNIFNRLSGISGGGQTSTNQIGAAGQNMANNVTSALGSAGNARSAGIVGGANAWTNAAGTVNQNYQNQQTRDLLAKLRGQQSYGNYGSAEFGGSPGFGGGTYDQPLYGSTQWPDLLQPT